MLSLSVRPMLMKIHLVFAAATLSTLLMYVVTGTLFLSDIDSGRDLQKFRVKQENELKKDKGQMRALAEKILQEKGVVFPTGRDRIKKDKKRKSWRYYWDGRNHGVNIRPSTRDARVAVVTVNTPGWLRRFFRLHKGGGGDIFTIFSMVSSVAIILILITGVIMGLQVRGFRKLTLISLSAGLLIFSSFVYYSQFF